MAALFRAPGGKTSPALLAAASRCGWTHVGWSPAGFLGDELSSDRHPNDRLLKQALVGDSPALAAALQAEQAAATRCFDDPDTRRRSAAFAAPSRA